MLHQHSKGKNYTCMFESHILLGAPAFTSQGGKRNGVQLSECKSAKVIQLKGWLGVVAIVGEGA